jgi:SWI/SNF-related matrix-associated actin-dependent regulator 1 of chromatin subfamily A
MLKIKDGIHPTANYQIISYDAARNPAIIRAISKYKWDLLICDEAHKMKNIDALTTRAILGNSRGEYHHGDVKMKAIAGYCTEHLALTGTLLLNRPSECYNLIRFFDHEAIDFMSEEKFKERYNRQADMKTIEGKRFKLESTSLELELQNRLRVNVMARHEKKDVFTMMKPPRYAIVKCEENGAVRGALDAEGMLGLSVEEIQTTKDFEILGHIAEARRLMGVALAPQISDYAVDFLEGSDEKLAIFGWHLEVLDIFEQELSRFGTVRIDGRKSPAARQKAVDDFTNLPNVRVFIGNIQAAGTGLDGLQQVCSRCYLAEPDWVPAQNEQAVSRLDRIGQENLVTAEIFVAPGSISEKILVKALEKLNVIHRVLDEKGK